MAGISSAERRRQALSYLERHTVMTLATYGAQGVWAAAVFYANEQFDLYFLTASHTRHGQDLSLSPWAAATIQENYADWPAIQGIQLEGDVDQLADQERTLAIALYQRKYPFLAVTDRAIQTELAKINWYRIRPKRLYFVDNSLGFGHRDEIDLYAEDG